MRFALISDPRVTSTPILESGEVLVDARRHSLPIMEKRAAANEWWPYVRESVLARLLDASKRLPEGIYLCLEEGYRPLSLQRRLFEAYVAEMRAHRGPLPDEQLAEEATLYVARPIGAPPHSTGGAVDVTLCCDDGNELDMGSISDEAPLNNGARNYTHSRVVTDSARLQRAMLVEAMTAVGFVNYPAEWWHWSYGDQYWAFRRRRQLAIFGAVEPPGSAKIHTSSSGPRRDDGADE